VFPKTLGLEGMARKLQPGTLRDEAEMQTTTILLADDERAVRTIAAGILRSRGYRVLEAADGFEALEIAVRYKGPIDLLLTDVHMPGLDGRELCQRLRDRRPKTRILFMSGDTHIEFEAGIAFLSKPFTAQVLVGKVNEVLKPHAVARGLYPAIR
jgi:CheY-like chemotaxis protein